MFDNRLIKLREEMKKTKKEVADALGMPYNTYSNYESNLREPNSAVLIKIADFYNVSTDYLLGLSNIKSVDTDVQTACKVTGLSENTIEHFINNNYKCRKNYLNAFLSQLPIYELFDTLEKYITAERVVKKICSDKISLPDIGKPFTKEELDAELLLEDYGYIILKSDYDILEFYEHKLNTLIADYLKSVCKDVLDNANDNPREE